MSGFLIGPCGVAPAASVGGSTDTNATAWAAAVVTAGGTVSGTQLSRVSDLITAYKSAGVYSLMDEEWLYASENAFTAQVSIVAPYHSHTLVSSPTFTANRGYSSNGTAYIDTGTAFGSNFSLNSLSFGGYVFTSGTTGGTATTLMGTHNAGYTYIKTLNASNNIEYDADENSFFAVANPGPNQQGNYIVSRTSSTNIDLYRNASALTSQTAASVSPISGFNFFVLAYNNAGGGPLDVSNGIVVSSAFIGGGLTSTQAAAKNSALNTYMTAVGANVY